MTRAALLYIFTNLFKVMLETDQLGSGTCPKPVCGYELLDPSSEGNPPRASVTGKVGPGRSPGKVSGSHWGPQSTSPDFPLCQMGSLRAPTPRAAVKVAGGDAWETLHGPRAHCGLLKGAGLPGTLPSRSAGVYEHVCVSSTPRKVCRCCPTDSRACPPKG